jgi:hypothetical protein
MDMVNSRELQLTLENRQLKRKLKSSKNEIKRLLNNKIEIANTFITVLNDVKRYASTALSTEIDIKIKELQDYIDGESVKY